MIPGEPFWKAQLRVSKNLGESRWTLARRLWWASILWFRGIRVGLSGMRTTQLGSRVHYKGAVWQISNWSNSPSSTLVGPNGEREEYVSRTKFRPLRTPGEYWHRFRTLRRWWMTSWFEGIVDARVYRSAKAIGGGR